MDRICGFVGKADKSKTWRWYTDHAENGRWFYIEHRNYNYIAIEDSRLPGFERYLRNLKYAFPEEYFRKKMKIGSSNDSDAVKAQYALPKGLDIRKTFHEKYSVNRQGYGEWIVSHYDIRDGMTVLEIGCGTGNFWIGHEDMVSRCGRLVLTDLSEGMLETAEKNLGKRDNIEYRKADIQSLPFADDSFDVVIANSMLYHVPDIAMGLKEVRRVLKKGGVFYCATYGEHNFTDKLAEWFELSGEDFKPNHNFTMSNGKEMLDRYFEEIIPVFYEDSLHVTEAEDLVEYLRSLASFKAVIDLPVQKIRDILGEHVTDGAIDLPKEYGMFICR